MIRYGTCHVEGCENDAVILTRFQSPAIRRVLGFDRGQLRATWPRSGRSPLPLPRPLHPHQRIRHLLQMNL